MPGLFYLVLIWASSPPVVIPGTYADLENCQEAGRQALENVDPREPAPSVFRYTCVPAGQQPDRR